MLRRLSHLRSSVPTGDTAWSLGFEAVEIAVVTLSFPLLGRTLGPAGYGAFVALGGLIGVASGFNTSGVSLTVYEHVVSNQEDPRRVARSCMGISMVMAVLTTLAVVGVASLTVRDLPLRTVLLFAVAELLASATAAVLIAIVMAVRGFTPATQLRILLVLGRGGVLVTMAVFDAVTLDNYAIGLMVVYGTFALLLMRRVRGILGASFWPQRSERSHVRTALLYAVSISASGLRSGGDKPVMTAAKHDVDAGLYGAAYRIFQLAGTPLRALAAATHLSFLEPKAGPGAQLRLARNLSFVVACYAAVAAVVLMIAAPLLPIVLGSEFEGTTTVLRWLAPVLVLSSLSGYPSNGLLGLGRNGLRTRIIVVTSLGGLALYVALIPAYSWRGAVVATAIIELVTTIVSWVALVRVQAAADAEARHEHSATAATT